MASVPVGTPQVRLHAIRARALAAYGDHAQARIAISAASAAQAESAPDELHGGLGGEFAFGGAKLAYYQALTLAGGNDPAATAEAAGMAIRLYESLPPHARSYGCEALARIQLARAQIQTGDPTAAAETLMPVLTLDPGRRIGSLARPLDDCRLLLTSSPARRAPAARQLDRQIAAFADITTTQAPPIGR